MVSLYPDCRRAGGFPQIIRRASERGGPCRGIRGAGGMQVRAGRGGTAPRSDGWAAVREKGIRHDRHRRLCALQGRPGGRRGSGRWGGCRLCIQRQLCSCGGLLFRHGRGGGSRFHRCRQQRSDRCPHPLQGWKDDSLLCFFCGTEDRGSAEAQYCPVLPQNMQESRAVPSFQGLPAGRSRDVPARLPCRRGRGAVSGGAAGRKGPPRSLSGVRGGPLWIPGSERIRPCFRARFP